MVLYCCALDCKSNGFDFGISFHKFPKDNSLKEVWLEKIQRLAMTVTDSTVLCSKHFMDSDYVDLNHKKRRLVADAVPTLFAWTKVFPEKRILKRDYSKISNSCNVVNDSTDELANGDNLNNHFGLTTIRHSKELLELYTGFLSCEHFYIIFQYLLPSNKAESINYFNVETTSWNEETDCNKLSLEDEFLMTMMTLRLALPFADLAFRFNVTKQQVSQIFITWINLMYSRFNSAVMWPSRCVISSNSAKLFTTKFPGVLAVMAGIQIPLNDSKTLFTKSNVEGCKCIIVCDPNGAIMFTSQMYRDSINFKDIARGCGLFKLLKKLLEKNFLQAGDTIMVDSDIDIKSELELLGLQSKTRSFQESEEDWPIYKSVAAIKRFLIFDGRPIPKNILDILDQIWSSVCFLTCLTSTTAAPILEL